MVCEQILGKLSEFDTSGKTIEYVDIEWHEAFKKIHKKTTDHGTELGIRMDDSILTRGLYQGDVLYADDEKNHRRQYASVRGDPRFPYSGSRKAGGKGLLRDRQPPCTAVLGRKRYFYHDLQ